MIILLFPVRRIEWGIFSGLSQCFIHRAEKNNYQTWNHCSNRMDALYSKDFQEKNNLFPKPKGVYVYD